MDGGSRDDGARAGAEDDEHDEDDEGRGEPRGAGAATGGLFYYRCVPAAAVTEAGPGAAAAAMEPRGAEGGEEGPVVAFCSGNPKIEVTRGTIRLYHERPPAGAGEAPAGAEPQPQQQDGIGSALGGLRGAADGVAPA